VLSEKETARTIAALRARLCEDDATIVQLSRVMRGECKFRGLTICEKSGELCLDGSKWKQCKVYLEAGGNEK
jgi:hypothetical protein